MVARMRNSLGALRRVIAAWNFQPLSQGVEVSSQKFNWCLSNVSSGLHRSLSSCPHFTVNSLEGVAMDPSSFQNIEAIFQENKEKCFDNHDSTGGFHCFSDYSRDIFSKVVTVQYSQFKHKGAFFRLNPSQILVKHEEGLVVDVGIPATLTAEDSVYIDRIVGPFGNMLKPLLDGVVDGEKHQHYKEVYDLLSCGMKKPWWNTLEDILCHPIFWSADRKLAAIASAKIWMSDGHSTKKHGISINAGRTRTFTPQRFKAAFAKERFFEMNYVVTAKEDAFMSDFPERVATVSIPASIDWKGVFTGQDVLIAASFDTNYYLGKGTGDDYYADMLTEIRNILFHFGDSNFDAFVVALGKRETTLDVPLIELDRIFCCSLSIYYALRQIGVSQQGILDVKF